MTAEDGKRSERALALDYGLARIGVAVADELGLLAHPRAFIAAKPEKAALSALSRLCKEEGITKILLGLPHNMDGTLGPAARRVEKFGATLEKVLGLDPEYLDERLTTVQAYALLRESGRDAKKAKGIVDSASACILLQSYLDSRRGP